MNTVWNSGSIAASLGATLEQLLYSLPSLPCSEPLSMFRKVALFAVLLTTSVAYAQLPHGRTLADLEQQGNTHFDPLSAPFIFEARSGKLVDLEIAMTELAFSWLPPDIQTLARGHGNDPLGRRRAIEAIAPYLNSLRDKVKNSKGILLNLAKFYRIRLHDYESDTHQIPFELISAMPIPERYFPAGLFCAGKIDKVGNNSARRFCVYPTNWAPKGQFTIDDILAAQTVGRLLGNGDAQLYLLAEYEGPLRTPLDRNTTAGVQAIRVLGYYLIKSERNYDVLASIVFQDRGPIGPLYQGKPIAPTIADGDNGGAFHPSDPNMSAGTAPTLKAVPMKGTTSARTKKEGPVIIDLH